MKNVLAGSRCSWDAITARVMDVYGDFGLPPYELSWDQLKEVVIIASSSRGGSSFFAELLRSASELLHFRAEINPFLKLAGLAYPDSGTGSDALDARHAAHGGAFLKFCAGDVGQRAPSPVDGGDWERFARQLYWRLTLQWPALDIGFKQVRQWLAAALAESPDDVQRLLIVFLHYAHTAYPQINPYFYDLNAALIKALCPDIRAPTDTPDGVLIEEPPFINVLPWQSVTTLDRPLVIKTPSNAFRLPFFRALFPRARLRILHLKRNPAAAVTGLYDGWRHHGFFSHRVARPLRIRGYSDVLPQYGRQWWKFDLPPGWEAWTERSLLEVCGFQWRSAHEAVLEYVDQQNVDYFSLFFEDLVGDTPRRGEVIDALAQWLNVSPVNMYRSITAMPRIMSTRVPYPGRWREYEETLAPVLDDPHLLNVTERLGYDLSRRNWI